jgi:hypothetical protein
MTMMRAIQIVAVAATALIAACTPPAHLDLGPAATAGPVTCDTSCAVNWQRAQFWIVKHSAWKVQTATDVIIETFNPTTSSSTYGFTVAREPLPGAKYRITIEPHCMYALTLCSPDTDDLKAAFYHYVATGTDILSGHEDEYTGIH